MNSSIIILLIVCTVHQVLMQQTMDPAGGQDQQNQGYSHYSHPKEPHPPQNQTQPGDETGGERFEDGQSGSQQTNNTGLHNQTQPEGTSDDSPSEQNDDQTDAHHNHGQIGEDGGHGNQSSLHEHTSLSQNGGGSSDIDPHDSHDHDHKPHQGHTPKTTHCRQMMCTAEYRPVCGKRRFRHCYEEKIFSNHCQMQVANACSNAGWVPCVPRKCRRPHHP